jgi:hypothetical protein
MRMAAHHFRIDLLDDVRDVEFPGFGGELRVKDDLQQQIAELLRELPGIAAVQRVQRLVGLLHQIRAQRIVRLLAVPGTAAGRPQPGLQGYERLKGLANLFAGAGIALQIQPRHAGFRGATRLDSLGPFTPAGTRAFRLGMRRP